MLLKHIIKYNTILKKTKHKDNKIILHRCFAVLIWEPKLLAVWLCDNEPFVFNVIKFYLSCSFSVIPLLYCLLCYHLWWNKGFQLLVSLMSCAATCLHAGYNSRPICVLRSWSKTAGCRQQRGHCRIVSVCVAHAAGADTVRRRPWRALAHQRVLRSLRTSRRRHAQSPHHCPPPPQSRGPPTVWPHRRRRQQLLVVQRYFFTFSVSKPHIQRWKVFSVKLSSKISTNTSMKFSWTLVPILIAVIVVVVLHVKYDSNSATTWANVLLVSLQSLYAFANCGRPM